MIGEYRTTHLIVGDPLFIAENISDEATIVAPGISHEVIAAWEAYSDRIGLGVAADTSFRRMSAGERVAGRLLFAIAVARLRRLGAVRFLFDGTLQMISKERLEKIKALADAERVTCEWWRRDGLKVVEVGA